MGQQASRLPIVADIPTAAPGLGFPEYIEALADAVRGGEPPQFTVGLYGAWGSGKSSLLQGICHRLEQDELVIPVLFDAWRYERGEDIVVPLLHRIATVVSALDADDPVARHLTRAVGSLVYSLSFKLGGFGFDGSKLQEGWQRDTLPALDEAFSKPFEELRKLPDALEGRRIVVLIDDLDRCSPGKIVTVMEAINLVMDVPGFVFVLAIDYDVLIEAIEQQYPHVSGHKFVEKIIQLPFRVPPLAIDAEGFLDELIPEPSSQWRSVAPDAFVLSIGEIAKLALRSNPRQVKRLINSFMLVNRVVERRKLTIDAEQLGALIGLQLGWPAAYEQFQFALVTDEPAPLDAMRGEDADPLLDAYVARFLRRRRIDVERLREMVALTQVVSADGAAAAGGRVPLSDVREERLTAFVEELWRRGFAPSRQSDRLYYNSETPDVRFALSDSRHHVRFEKRVGPGSPWILWESYLVTRETDLALRVIDEPERHFTNRR